MTKPQRTVPPSSLRHIRTGLFAWWQEHARDLPWRFGRTTPWGVLVSEVMSQQTQMSRVVPYWQAWMEVWPTPQALAKASTAEVITAWGKLGYPRRALRLQECARVVSDQYGGELPQTYDELVSLPGIGDYTASAVLSFAFHRKAAVVDTNIRRVLSRVFLGEESLGGSATPRERKLAQEVLPRDRQAAEHDDVVKGASHGMKHRPSSCTSNEPEGIAKPEGTVDITEDTSYAVKHRPSLCTGNEPEGIANITDDAACGSAVPASVTWNQAIMELGALVCTAKSPMCQECPIADSCAFLAAGRPHLGEKRTRPRQRFQGTNRQVRGKILDALRGLEQTNGTLPRTSVEALWDDRVQLDQCVASLDEDGLIVIHPDRSLSLPR